MGHEVVAAAEGARQRHGERDAFDPLDPQLRHALLPGCLVELIGIYDIVSKT
jgi:hypothetical protein